MPRIHGAAGVVVTWSALCGMTIQSTFVCCSYFAIEESKYKQ
jgi:hypothetical protein